MAKYFHISSGLRGCYMPESSAIVMCKTRRELKALLSEEAETIREGDYIGLNKKAVSSVAASVWREAHKKNPTYLDFALPYRRKDQTHCPYGLFVSVSNRSDYLERQKQEESF